MGDNSVVIDIDTALNNTSNKLTDDSKDQIKDQKKEGTKRQWAYRTKLLLKSIGERSFGYQWLHEQEQIYYERLDQKFKIAQIIVIALTATVTSGSMIGLIADTGSRDNLTMIILISLAEMLLSLISAVLLGIREQSDYVKKSDNHRNAAFEFSKIYHSIQEQFAISHQHREDEIIFLKNMLKIYDDLRQKMPIIRQKTLDQYEEKTKNKDITKLDGIDEHDNIDISSEEKDKKDNKTVMIPKSQTTKMAYELDRWMKKF
jgi:hypothetical protein